MIGNASPSNPGVLAYIVTLRPGAGELAYSLVTFRFRVGRDNEPRAELEQVLTADNPDTRSALATLHKRLAAVVAGW